MIIREGRNAGKHLCSICRELKLATEFNKASGAISGYRSECRLCQKLYWNRRVVSGVQIQYKREYRRKNKDRLNIVRNKSRNQRRKTDINFKLVEKLRGRIGYSIKRKEDRQSHSLLLGCSIDNFRLYIESKFIVGMTWDNHGTEWELDHIIPCAIFDLTKPEHQRSCFHFSNYQPLWKYENRAKGSKLFYEKGALSL